MIVLGIHIGHNSSAALLKDGKILACVAEERFTKIKNQAGIPTHSINFVLDYCKVKPKDVDLAILSTKAGAPQVVSDYLEEKSRLSLFNLTWKVYHDLFTRYKSTDRLIKANPISRRMEEKFTQKLVQNIKHTWGIDNVTTAEDHQFSHAYAALYASNFRDENVLVFTCDGEGDFLCATVNIFDGEKITRLSESFYTDSLGWLWIELTRYLGMKAGEHEYKVMGLAPYAPDYGVEKAYNKFFKNLITIDDDLRLNSSINQCYSYKRIQPKLDGLRFDYIAGALQRFTEELLIHWVLRAIAKYKIRTLCFGGGVFMNIKANMEIGKLQETAKCYFMPSGGDESVSIGAAYFGAKMLKPDMRLEPLQDLYLGPESSDGEVRELLESSKGLCYERYNDKDAVIGELLSKGKIIARCDGKAEWGARGLGNRSILADASNFDVLKTINNMIKQRDFWMPFAPTILEEYAGDYVLEPDVSKVNGQYMIVGFESTPKGRQDLRAASHPYDYTIRPQLLPRIHNEGYYRCVEKFLEYTGRSGILNTSFNIHGDPIVNDPADAIKTLEKSGLEYLMLGNYLVTKKLN